MTGVAQGALHPHPDRLLPADRARIVWHYSALSESRTYTIRYRLRRVAVAYDDVVDVNLKVWGDEWKVPLQGPKGSFPGIPVTELSKDQRAARLTPIIGAYPKAFVPLICILPGMAATILLPGIGTEGNLEYNQALPAMIGKYLPTGAIGIAVTGLLAAFMAGMAANISSFNAVFTYDLWQDYIRPGRPDRYYLTVGRWVTVGGVAAAVHEDHCVLTVTLPARAAGPADLYVRVGEQEYRIVNALRYVDPAAGVRLKTLGDGFIALVKMLISPIIFCTVVLGIAGAGDMKKVGRVGAKALGGTV